MELEVLQKWEAENTQKLLEGKSREFLLAILLEQAGQLAEAIIHKDGTTTEKEVADVLLSLVCIANNQGVDMSGAAEKHIVSRTGEDFVNKLNQ